MGCLPSLYAVSAEEIEGGEYIGPSGVAEISGINRLSLSRLKAN